MQCLLAVDLQSSLLLRKSQECEPSDLRFFKLPKDIHISSMQFIGILQKTVSTILGH